MKRQGIAARIHTTERQITRYGRAHPVPDVAGHRAWYQTETSGPPELIGMATLTVEAGACMYEFTTDVKVLSLDQLRDIAAGTTYADCTDKSTWTAPVS